MCYTTHPACWNFKIVVSSNTPSPIRFPKFGCVSGIGGGGLFVDPLYIYIYKYVCACMYIYVRIFFCLHKTMWVCLSVCMCSFLFICMYVSVLN